MIEFVMNICKAHNVARLRFTTLLQMYELPGIYSRANSRANVTIQFGGIAFGIQYASGFGCQCPYGGSHITHL